MPSTHQSASASERYPNEYQRMVGTKPRHVLKLIEPMSEDEAREWVAACNAVGVDQAVVKHFAEAVQRFNE